MSRLSPLAVFATWSLLVASGCAKEAARVTVNGPVAPVSLKAAPVDVWVDMDISCKGEPQLSIRVSLLVGKSDAAQVTCDPFDVTVKMYAVETDIMGDVRKKYQGKMKCTIGADVTRAGTFDAVAQGQLSANCKATKLDVLLKQ